MEELIYKDLTYKINGLLFEVDNLIGFGQKEKVYSDALAELLIRENIDFKRELYYPIVINNKVIAKRYFDFLIDDKVVIEVKVADFQFRNACSQLYQYLKLSKLKLGMIARFTKYGVRTKRILNIRPEVQSVNPNHP